MNQIRDIVLKGNVYQYNLKYKAIKKCYLRLREGKIFITSSFDFSISQIEELIINNQDKIVNYIINYKPHYDLVDGGYIELFGKEYIIKIYDMGIKKIIFKDNLVICYHKNIDKLISQYLLKYLLEYLDKKIDYYLLNDFNLKKPIIKLKKTKGRWGACYPYRNLVIFNPSLVHLSTALIDYVIVHELCHFIQSNHSKIFYQEIYKRLPNYKSLEKQLKEKTI